MARELGTSRLYSTNKPGVGSSYVCTQHGHLRPGWNYVLVQRGEEWWWACANCLYDSQHYHCSVPEEAPGAEAQP